LDVIVKHERNVVSSHFSSLLTNSNDANRLMTHCHSKAKFIENTVRNPKHLDIIIFETPNNPSSAVLLK